MHLAGILLINIRKEFDMQQFYLAHNYPSKICVGLGEHTNYLIFPVQNQKLLCMQLSLHNPGKHHQQLLLDYLILIKSIGRVLFSQYIERRPR